eukprot:357822-Pleurochrysis_carterae.AAC.1
MWRETCGANARDEYAATFAPDLVVLPDIHKKSGVKRAEVAGNGTRQVQMGQNRKERTKREREIGGKRRRREAC